MKNRIITVLLLCALTLSMFTACAINGKNDDTRTLFIYMCGSSLESKQGHAGKNIDELLSASAAGNFNIVIEAGGANKWRSHDIAGHAVSRYEIRKGKLKLIETFKNKNMGKSDTLSNFLSWGQERYNTKNNMLVFWDHGAGSVNGLCFDENYSYDSLTLKEIKKAFKKAKLKNKFELIGFDSCLMASIETAHTIKDYAKYMIASEEIEPSGGWDYKALAESYSSGDKAVKTGKVVCDSFIKKCKKKGRELTASLSLFDLSKTDALREQWKKGTDFINQHLVKKNYISKMLEATSNCIKFGGDNKYEGCANMIDLGDFLKQAGFTQKKIPEMYKSISDFVVYKANGTELNNQGVSFYYPVVYSEKEIKKYVSLDVNESYNEFLKHHYLNIPEKTIEFKDKGRVSKDGAFEITLSKNSKKYLSSIDYLLMTKEKNGTLRVLCTDNDLFKYWDELRFKSSFRGVTLALDGHRLFSNALSDNGEVVSLNAPLIVNGKRTSLRFEFIWDKTMFNNGYYTISGTWNGIDENGIPDNDITPLKKGDKVQIVTGTDSGKVILGDKFKIGKDGGKITELPLDGKIYKYVFVVKDLFGNTFFSDMATLEMTKTYDELKNNALPDGEYAAKVIKIEPYNNAKSNTYG